MALSDIQQGIQQQLSIAESLRRPDNTLRDALSQYRQQGTESDERLSVAQEEAGRDPRNIVDKITPGLLNLGGLIDMLRGKPNVTGKLQRALATERGKTAGKRDVARQKLLDTIGLEDRKGRRRATELGVTGQIAGQKAADYRTRVTTASKIAKEAKGPEKKALSVKDQAAANAWSILQSKPISEFNDNERLMVKAGLGVDIESAGDSLAAVFDSGMKFAQDAVKNYHPDVDPAQAPALMAGYLRQYVQMQGDFLATGGLDDGGGDDDTTLPTTDIVGEQAPQFGRASTAGRLSALAEKKRQSGEAQGLVESLLNIGGRFGGTSGNQAGQSLTEEEQKLIEFLNNKDSAGTPLSPILTDTLR